MKFLRFVRDEFEAGLKRYRIGRATAIVLMAFPVVIVPTFGWFLALAKTHAATYRLLVENGPVEMATFLFFIAGAVAAAILSSRVVRSGGPKIAVRFYAGMALLSFLGGMEEISWGQSFLNFATPAAIRSINDQGELNIHNLEGVMELDPFLLFLFGLLIVVALWMSYRPKLRRFGAPTLIAPYVLTLLVTGFMCFLVYVWYFDEAFDLVVGMLSEVDEMLMGLTLLLYAVLNARAARDLGLLPGLARAAPERDASSA